MTWNKHCMGRYYLMNAVYSNAFLNCASERSQSHNIHIYAAFLQYVYMCEFSSLILTEILLGKACIGIFFHEHVVALKKYKKCE